MVDHLLQLWSWSPNQTSAPTRSAVGPLPFGSLSITEELSRKGALDCGVSIDRLPAGSAERLRDPFSFPSELTLDRQASDGTWSRVFTGPLLSRGIRGGDTVQIHAPGLLAYLEVMGVDGNTGDQTFDGTDQHQIVKTLVDAWQALDYGDFGIDTSGVSNAGTTRTVSYTTGEINVTLDRVIELGERQGGFDVAVDPDTRALQLWTPTRGTDRTGSVHFDARNIGSADDQASVAPGSSATSVHAVSSGGGVDDTVLTSTQTDSTGMSVFGRRFHGTSERNVTVQGTLDDKATQALNDRTSMHFSLGPDVKVALGADWDDFGVGDTVDVKFDSGLGEVALQPRIVKRTLTVDSSGEERMQLGLA